MDGRGTNSNRVWVGVAAGLLTTAVLAAVGIGAYRAGQRSDQTIEVVGRATGDGDTARTIVVDGWRGGWHGPGPGFVLVPLVVTGIVLLVLATRRRGGPMGPPGGWQWEREDWHRRAHGVTAGDAPADAPYASAVSTAGPPPPTSSPPE